MIMLWAYSSLRKLSIQQIADNCLSVFDHFVGLALKGLSCLIISDCDNYDFLFFQIFLTKSMNRNWNLEKKKKKERKKKEIETSVTNVITCVIFRISFWTKNIKNCKFLIHEKRRALTRNTTRHAKFYM